MLKYNTVRRILLFALSFALSAPVAGGATAEMRLSQEVHSEALHGPLRYSVYLPDKREGRRFPTVYLLHGVGDNERSYPKAGDVAGTMDRLIASGEIAPMIVVMPAAKRSWYVDSAAIGGPGDYETAIMRDLIAHIDQTYPTDPRPAARFVTGHSMGGFGALRLAFKYPERFGAVAAMSAALWDRVEPGFELPESAKGIFAGSFGQPFDPARFLAQRPRAYLPALKERGRTPPIYLTAGDDDHFEAYRSTFDLFLRLRREGLAVELRITDGGHTWRLWRETALPNVLRWFSRQRPERPTGANSQ